MKYYVYILRSIKDQSTYVGCTSDLRKRLQVHHKGLSQYTKHRGPFNLVWYSFFDDRDKAFTFEKYLKSGSGRAFTKKHIL